MASWQDEPVKLTPYIQQQPIDAMGTIGMEREHQFQEGIATVQGYYDSLLGLPIAKREIQDYVKQKVGQLNNAVGQSISGDFSDRRLINQIGALSGQISSDPIVENGVQSTARIQSGMAKAKADQERAIKEGKNPTNNINDFNDQVNAWLSDGKHNTSFNSDYTPYIDTIGEILKLYKEQNQGMDIGQDALRLDEHGNPTVNPTMIDGISAGRIQNVINLVMQRGDVQAQLGVDGRQKYKGATQQSIADALTQMTNESTRDTQEAINKLQTILVTDGSANKSVINDKIKELIEKNKIEKEQFNKDMKFISENFEGFKPELVKREISSNFINAYTTQILKENPLFNQNIKEAELKLRDKEYQEKLKMDEFTRQSESIKLAIAKNKAEQDAKSSDVGYIATEGLVDSSMGEKNEATMNQHLADAELRYEQESWNQAHILATNSGQIDPGKFVNGKWIPNVGSNPEISYPDANSAIIAKSKMLIEASAGYVNGQPSELAKNTSESLTNILDDIKSTKHKIESINSNYTTQINTIKQKVGNDNYYSIYAVQNHLPGWEAELDKLTNQITKNYENYDVSSLSEYLGVSGVSVKNVVRNAILSNLVVGTLPGGKSALDKKLTQFGINPSEYHKAVSNVSSNDTEFLAQRALDFKNAQGVENIKDVQLTPTKPAEEELVKKQFQQIINAASEGKNLIRGKASNAQDALDALKSQTLAADKYFHTGFDTTTGEGYIDLVVNGKHHRLEGIPENFYYEVFPNLLPDRSFDNKFRNRLVQTNWASTDVTGIDGVRTAYSIPQLPTSDYSNVMYHLVPSGDMGKYNLRVWIKRKSDGKYIDGGEGGTVLSIPGLQTTNLNRAQVMDIIERLKDPTLIKSYDLLLNPPK